VHSVSKYRGTVHIAESLQQQDITTRMLINTLVRDGRLTSVTHQDGGNDADCHDDSETNEDASKTTSSGSQRMSTSKHTDVTTHNDIEPSIDIATTISR
jgi:hypothetical protein